MAITPVNNPAISQQPAQTPADTIPSGPSTAAEESTVNSGIKLQRERTLAYRSSLLEAHQEVNLSIKNEPQALLYKSALEAINEELKSELGDNAIQKGYESGLDVSPEATADRIVKFSTALFPLYQEQHPELSLTEQLNRFMEIIGGGIDQGFTEAKDILDGLGVLEGEIEENIEKTYNLVQEGLEAFRNRFETPDSPTQE